MRIFNRRLYFLGSKVALFIIRKGSPLQYPFFSGLYSTIWSHINKELVRRPLEFHQLERLMMQKHFALVETATKLSDLREKHIALSKAHSKLKRGLKKKDD